MVRGSGDPVPKVDGNYESRLSCATDVAVFCVGFPGPKRVQTLPDNLDVLGPLFEIREGLGGGEV